MPRTSIIASAVAPGARAGYGLGFHLTLLYLVFEYARPQATIPGLDQLHLPGLVSLFLATALLFSGRISLSEARTKLFATFLLFMALHIPFALNTYWAFQATRAMLLTFVAYLAIVTFVDSTRKLQTFTKAWIAIHVYLAITGLLKGGTGIGGFLGDENDFALVLNMVIPFSFFLALEAKTWSQRTSLLLTMSTFAACIVLTWSRGGFLGLIAVGLYCWLRAPRKTWSSLVIGVFVLGLFCFAPATYWQRIHTITEDDTGTGEERIYSWKAGGRMFLDYPIFGVGPENFPWHFESYEPPGGINEKLHGGRAAHSLYFTLLPELGIIGTILFFWMLGSSLHALRFPQLPLKRRPPLQRLRKPTRDQTTGLTLALQGSILALLVSGTFISVLYYPPFWIWMGMVTALTRTRRTAPLPVPNHLP